MDVDVFLILQLFVLWISLDAVTGSKTVLITGGAGFIGFHTGLKLATQDKENRVVVLDTFDDSYNVGLKKARANVLVEEGGVTVHTGDVCSRQMLEHLFKHHEFTHVIHLAGKNSADKSMSDPIGYLTANIECTLRLLEILEEYPETRLIYASSYSVYGIQTDSPVSVLSSIGPPTSVYAALKIGMEEVVSSFCPEFHTGAVGLRLFDVYGPWGRPDGDIYNMAIRISEGDKAKIYRNKESLVASRDYTYIDDVVNGIMAAMNYIPFNCNEIFNIGSGQKPVSMETVFSLINDKLGGDSEYTDLPNWESLVTSADIELTKEKLKYSPRTDINDGIENFLKWYKDYHHRNKWISAKPNATLKKELHKNRNKFVNQKFHDRISSQRLKYEHYAIKNNIPVSKLFRPRKFIEFKGKRPSVGSPRHLKGKSVKELKSFCQDIDECVAFDTSGRLYNYVGLKRNWVSFRGKLYVADIDICQAGLHTCYGNCTCTSVGPSMGRIGCEKGHGLIKEGNSYYCRQLYSPNRPTVKEEEYKIQDHIEKRDWYSLIKNNPRYIHYKNVRPLSGTVAYYREAAGDVERLGEACDRAYHCVGFTTDGDLKGTIDLTEWKKNEGVDFYVRDINYCEFGYLNCTCNEPEPRRYKYDCPGHYRVRHM